MQNDKILISEDGLKFSYSNLKKQYASFQAEIVRLEKQEKLDEKQLGDLKNLKNQIIYLKNQMRDLQFQIGLLCFSI